VEQSINGVYQQIQTLPSSSTGARIIGLTAGTSYTFRVRAANATGASAYSNSAGATTTAAGSSVPSAPSGLVAVAVSTTEIQLTWADNSDNETNFLLERSTGGVFSQFNMRGQNTTSFRVIGLSPGTKYSFRVRAQNAAGTSAYTNTATTATLAALTVKEKAPTAPSRLVAVSVSATEIELSWQDNSRNETNFRIERLVSGRFREIRQVGKDASRARVANLVPGATDTFRVRASHAGGFSPYSNEIRTQRPATGRK
jgi:titin